MLPRGMLPAPSGRGVPRLPIYAFALTQMIALAGFSQPSWATEPMTPVGTWRTIDDRTGAPKAVVSIFKRGDKLVGVVERSLEVHAPHSVCDGCTDDRRGKPILGMEIIRDLVRDGDQWDGGTILDPETGKIYKCRLILQDHGQKLAVRGFIGIALLGRTQVWERLK